MTEPARLAILISGSGRNQQAIMEACAAGRIPGRVCGVISSRADAHGLERAARAGIPAAVVRPRDYPSKAAYDGALSDHLQAFDPGLIALAGFMRVLGASFVTRYRGRMVNIHPSLLPEYRGLHTHARALAAGDHQHGASIHFVTEELDGGPVIMQGRIAVHDGDTPEALADRVMQQVELRLYPAALALLAAGRVRLVGDHVTLDGAPLDQALRLEDFEPD